MAWNLSATPRRKIGAPRRSSTMATAISSCFPVSETTFACRIAQCQILGAEIALKPPSRAVRPFKVGSRTRGNVGGQMQPSTQQSRQPRAKICGHCEDQNNLVTPQNGVSVNYEIAEGVQIEIFLHHACAEAWSQHFHIPIPETNPRREFGLFH